MKKRFTAGVMGIVVLALLISAAAGIYGISSRESASARKNLRELLTMVEAQIAGNGMEPALSAFKAAAPEKRLTVIDAGGAVLVDSDADVIENHAGRPEIRDAQDTGWGEATRHSETLDLPMLYVAKRFADGSVGRAATPLSTIDSMVWDSVPLLIVAVLAALLLSFLLARALAGTLARPLDVVREALQDVLYTGRSDAISRYEPDEELRPVFRLISGLVDHLGEDLNQIKAERDKVALILDCMDEGLILLDEENAILAVNRAARELFGLPEDQTGGARVFLRSKPVKSALKAIRREQAPAVLDLSDPLWAKKELRFFLSPVSQRKYEGKNVGTAILISDVTELKKAENARQEFTANVSHELKTPLTSIKGVTEMLSKGMVHSEEDRQRFYLMISVEVDQLIALINDILDLSELESAKIDAPEETASPLNAANEVAGLLKGEAEKRNVTVTVSGDGGEARIAAPRLRELLQNLMGNAVRYCKDGGGKVDVTVKRSESGFSIRVADDGIGIPPEAQDHVFERFYRVDKGRSRASGGTGLGLAIVKHICQLYGGEVGLQSTPGEGSVFTVRLPV